ncbi:MAG TPA: hypothetical protein VFW77_04055 [Candidatus Saccharimonadales bacterium]|nr:hypothetical protein [Candidatus Saccharimonadales bacterium]
MVGRKTEKDDESKKPDDSKPQVNDVAKPGQTAATPTSRPIITPHGGMIKQDPMVAGASDEEDMVDKKSESRISAKPELKLKPISDDKSADDDKSDNEPETKQDKDEEKSEPDDKKVEAEIKSEEEKPSEDTPDESKGDESAAIDSLASSAGSNKQTAQETEEEKKRGEKIKELAESRKYYVPIVEGGHKASYERLLSWLILILLLISIGIYLAIDAGYLDVGISLPYNFIGN